MSKIPKNKKYPLSECQYRQPYKTKQPIHEEYGLHICLARSHKKEHITAIYQKPVPRYFYFYNISHLINGHGWYWTPEKGKQNFKKGKGVLVTPKLVHDYTGYDYYDEDYIGFYGPVADHLFNAGIIKPGIISIGTSRRLLPIIELASIDSRDSQIQANIALQQLLVELYLENKSQGKNRRQEKFDKLLQKVCQNPQKWWSISELATAMDMHINHFAVFFSNQIGTTPKKYIDCLKIKNAAEDLRSSNLSIAKIAENYGYQDQFHFSKRFKKIIGTSPSNYRKKLL